MQFEKTLGLKPSPLAAGALPQTNAPAVADATNANSTPPQTPATSEKQEFKLASNPNATGYLYPDAKALGNKAGGSTTAPSNS